MYTTLCSQVVYVGSSTYLDPALIVRLEADGNYTRIYLANGKELLIARTLKVVLLRLEPHSAFVRISRHEAVNPRYIRVFRENGALILHDETRLVPSRRRLKTVRESLSAPKYPWLLGK
ncbi:hypothetical protein GCM10027275_48410 [Rhabdobacter roseus]|uniref:DNA-binding LytR/AlgR family response regulator n=1 Tax=Rhabdobacter roseus TaxID=1655419 RepID=A0A840TUI2_9BACT|nr:LytTR family DNA-binding domain-containing protein [Rhabdobacter roseus]MBB5286904.1 DNA-binding LytR/AlgR family response regulator [Rhabdobacter roseus]